MIESVDDVMRLPVKVDGRCAWSPSSDVAPRCGAPFKTPTGFARIDGEPSVALEIKKRVGANIIEDARPCARSSSASAPRWPQERRRSRYLQDESEHIRTHARRPAEQRARPRSSWS
ncbi:MAG: hypothetical protein U5K43_06025 [Halofilum sp. (in: g-proteobacteria)]|nr:hypothetical protein [Halofilum sp. (in: g-proteobacteria)]